MTVFAQADHFTAGASAACGVGWNSANWISYRMSHLDEHEKCGMSKL